MPDRRPTIALIGCGGIAKGHVTGINACEADLVALCDLYPASAEKLAKLVEGPAPRIFTDYREMLETLKPDIVDVATPPGAHCGPTCDALRSGAHVFCEKPAALNPDEVRQMRDVARECDRVLLFYSSRFRKPTVREARRRIAAGELGTIYRADIQFFLPFNRGPDVGRPGWFSQRKMAGGGGFMDMGQYFFDALMYMLDWPQPQTLTASAFWDMPYFVEDAETFDVEDHMALQARLDNGITLTMDATARVNANWRWTMRILGTQGALHLDNTRPAEPKDVLIRRAPDSTTDEPRFLEEPLQGDDSTKSAGDMEARLNKLIAFMHDPAARPEVEDHGTTGEEAVWIADFFDIAYRSAEAGKAWKKGDN